MNTSAYFILLACSIEWRSKVELLYGNNCLGSPIRLDSPAASMSMAVFGIIDEFRFVYLSKIWVFDF